MVKSVFYSNRSQKIEKTVKNKAKMGILLYLVNIFNIKPIYIKGVTYYITR